MEVERIVTAAYESECRYLGVKVQEIIQRNSTHHEIDSVYLNKEEDVEMYRELRYKVYDLNIVRDLLEGIKYRPWKDKFWRKVSSIIRKNIKEI